jgi:hypothetical protein
MFRQKELIEEIREVFGSGRDDPAIKNLRELASGLVKVVEDSAASPSHFIYELIQNADDNSYEQKVTPWLKFAIDDQKIVVQNNEIGFTEEDVRAICKPGQSPKKNKGRHQCIGEKGIGFRSVFRVTESPQIFSNGFQFGIDSETRVVPYWIDEVPSFVSPGMTNIVLPLKEHAKESLSDFWICIPCEVLLFLRKLRQIEFLDRRNSKNLFRKICRYQNQGIVVIEELKEQDNKKENSVKRFKLVRKELDVPEGSRQGKNRKDVERTEIVLAFPLTEDGEPKPEDVQHVYAFLPVRQYGFKFIIQGDFLLTASREEIHTDECWNMFLRDNIANIFMDAVEEFKNDPKLRMTFYGFIPLEADIRDAFFKPVVNEIYDLLRKTPCVLTEGGVFEVPEKVVRIPKDFQKVKELLPNQVLVELTGFQYIASEVSAKVEILEDILGVLRFDFDLLLACLNHEHWVAHQSDEWLLKLYEFLSALKLSANEIENLRHLKILRLENGEMVDLASGQVFFPLSKKTNYGFEHELRVLRRVLSGYPENALNMLKTMGVREPEPREIVETLIVPFYDTTTFDNKDSKRLLGYTRYIKDNADELKRYQALWARLKEVLRLRDKRKGEYLPSSCLFLGRDYDSEYDIEWLFEDIDQVRFVGPEYLETDKKPLEWKQFFLDLDLKKFPLVDESGEFHKPMTCKEFEILVAHLSAKEDRDRISLLLKILNDNWLSHFSGKLHELKIERPNQWATYITQGARSSFFLALTRNKIFPATNGGFYCANEIYVDNEETRQVFGDSVPYLAIELDDKMIRELGIKTGPTVKDILDRLGSLVTNRCQDKALLEKMYESLTRFVPNNPYSQEYKDCNSRFDSCPLIFVPDHPQKYLRTSDVLWNDPDNMFVARKGLLEKHYPNLRHFFVRILGIKEMPSIEDFVSLLHAIAKEKHLTNEDELRVFRIYMELNHYFETQKDSGQTEKLLQSFANDAVFLTEKHGFRKKEDGVFVSDDDQLKELFEDSPKVAFLKLPENDFPRFRFLIERCGLPYLSMAVKVEFGGGAVEGTDDELQKTIAVLANYIRRYLYWRLPERYKEMGDTVRDKLANIECYKARGLKALYSLNRETRETHRSALACDGKLYVDPQKKPDNVELAVEISRLLTNSGDLEDFIALLLDRKTPDDKESFMKAKHIDKLPADYEPAPLASGREAHDEEKIGAVENERPRREETGDIKIHVEVYKSRDASRNMSRDPHPSWAEQRHRDDKVTSYEPDLETRQQSHAEQAQSGDIEERREIGRKGEIIACKSLMQELQKKYPELTGAPSDFPEKNERFRVLRGGEVVAEVLWLNYNRDSGQPYDILVKENGEETFIEVKATIDKSQCSFNISGNQWREMKEKSERYWIYRVYGAESAEPHIEKIHDPYRRWLDGEIQAEVIRLRL